ncbi:unnamed protein product [Cylicocyclus nassatus]|uniref:Uncharacterized protein n=1 Tax=Cylicocyclus nassatus TaxID=53992 RepID=A0AA36GMI0_CYLNA|nr:unnamed protein product [Cylicocyclus nassatus]
MWWLLSVTIGVCVENYLTIHRGKPRLVSFHPSQCSEDYGSRSAFLIACEIAQHLAIGEEYQSEETDVGNFFAKVADCVDLEVSSVEDMIKCFFDNHGREDLVRSRSKIGSKRKSKESFLNVARVSKTLPELYTLGVMNELCKYCNARYFASEPKTVCCNSGVNIVSESVYKCERDDLLSWFWDIALNNKEIFQMLRPINNMLSCAGINIKLKEFGTHCGPVPLVLEGKY